MQIAAWLERVLNKKLRNCWALAFTVRLCSGSRHVCILLFPSKVCWEAISMWKSFLFVRWRWLDL